jgi:hypothetical protein
LGEALGTAIVVESSCDSSIEEYNCYNIPIGKNIITPKILFGILSHKNVSAVNQHYDSERGMHG